MLSQSVCTVKTRDAHNYLGLAYLALYYHLLYHDYFGKPFSVAVSSLVALV